MVAHTDHIHRLRVRGSPSVTPALRLRLARLLGGAELRPPEMPPAAILFVRHLADPLPGHLTPATWRPTPAWEQAARQALAAWYRRAVRPRQGTLPDDAPAVCFRSTAELLACLALDLSRGRAYRRWWWRPWLQSGAASGAAIEAAWMPEARHVPAALDLLAAWQVTAPVLAALTESQARSVLAAIEAAFDLPALLPMEPGVATPPSDAIPRKRSAPPSASQRPYPWSPFVAALLPPELAPAQTALLGIGLTLHRQPARVCTAAFQADVRQWWQAPTAQQFPHGREARSATAKPARPGDATADEVLPSAHQPDTPASPSATPRIRRPAEAASPPAPGALTSSSRAEPPRSVDRPPATDEAAPIPASTRATPSPPTEPPAAASTPPLSPTTPAAEPASAPSQIPAPAAPTAADSIATQWGGVFYLINAMTRLDLPACFGGPLAEVSRWTLLEALPRGLLGEAFEVLPPDPLWHSLAMLDGRAPDEPLAAGLTPAPFRLPAAWMDHLPPPGGVCWAAGRTQLSLWTPGGVILADGPRTGQRPTTQVETEIERLGLNPAAIPRTRRSRRALPTASVASSAPSPPAPGLLAWTQRVIPAFRSILLRWLDLPAETLVDTLLHHPGRLYLSSSHVDLVLPLDAISLPVRLAGLDRDPGWQPTFGRVILVHFD